jgi:hypothetical protein
LKWVVAAVTRKKSKQSEEKVWRASSRATNYLAVNNASESHADDRRPKRTEDRRQSLGRADYKYVNDPTKPRSPRYFYLIVHAVRGNLKIVVRGAQNVKNVSDGVEAQRYGSSVFDSFLF